MATYNQPVIPQIAKAFENDPRTKIAQSILANGSSTAPVAGGGWAFADGIARALQGVAGGVMQKKQMKHWNAEQEAYRSKTAEDIAAILSPQPAPAQAPAQAAPVPQAPPAPAQPSLGAESAPMAAPAPQPATLRGMVPGIRQIDPNTALDSAQGGSLFTDPLAGRGRPTSGYGTRKPPIAGASSFHNGTDYAAPEGSPVHAAAGGTVISAGFNKRGGNFVRVRHPDGSITGYAHLAGYDVQVGDEVQPGQPIGQVGKTGKATGPHLHFTVRGPDGKPINPTSIKYGEAAGAPAQLAAALTPLPELEELPQAAPAENAVQSRRLEMARRLVQNGNPFSFNDGMEMLDKGLTEQNSADEAAAGRKQNVSDMGYAAGLQRYGASRSAAQQDTYATRAQERGQGYAVANREDAQMHDMSMAAKNHVFDMERAGFDRETSISLARMQDDSAWKRTMAQIEASRDTLEAKAAARRTAFFNTPTGAKIMDAAQARMGANQEAAAKLAQFERLNRQRGTGGALGIPGVGKVAGMFGTTGQMEALTQSLSIALSGALKGAISDKEGERILASLPSIGKPGNQNVAIIRDAQNALKRANEYEQFRMESFANGSQINFNRSWSKYTNDVPLGSAMTYEQYMSLPRVGGR
jgi:murein DD-endopeptidase MepM/ murein hydrolase activator NlpD